MALAFRKDGFATGTGTGTLDVVGGRDFTPKVALLWSDQATAEGFKVGYAWGFGWGVDATHRATDGAAGADAANPSQCGKRYNTAALLNTVLPDLTTQLSLDLAAWLSPGYRVNRITNAVADTLVHDVLVGGDDLTNVIADSVALQTVGANQDVAVGFDADLVLVWSAHRASTGTNTTADLWTLGAFDREGHQWAVAHCGIGGSATPPSKVLQRTDRCFVAINTAGALSSSGHIAPLGDWPSNGFRIVWDDQPGTANLMHYLALRGGRYRVGAFSKSTNVSVPVDDDVTEIGWQPRGVLLSSHGLAASTAIGAPCRFSLGAGDGTRQGGMWTEHAPDGSVPTEANGWLGSAKAFRLASGPDTVLAECDLSMLATGFRAHWTVNDAVARQVCYVAFGDAIPGGDAFVKVQFRGS